MLTYLGRIPNPVFAAARVTNRRSASMACPPLSRCGLADHRFVDRPPSVDDVIREVIDHLVVLPADGSTTVFDHFTDTVLAEPPDCDSDRQLAPSSWHESSPIARRAGRTSLGKESPTLCASACGKEGHAPLGCKLLASSDTRNTSGQEH